MWRVLLPIAREGNTTSQDFNPERIDALSRFDMRMPAEDVVKMLVAGEAALWVVEAVGDDAIRPT
jgi:hypothetical protein